MSRYLEDGGDGYYNEENISYACTRWAPGVGFAGIVCAVVFASKLPLLAIRCPFVKF